MRKLIIIAGTVAAAGAVAAAAPSGPASADYPIHEWDSGDCHNTIWVGSHPDGSPWVYTTVECGPSITFSAA